MANTAADILHMLSSLEGCEEVLTQLLQQKNLEGYTPFMAAVAYKVRGLFDSIRRYCIEVGESKGWFTMWCNTLRCVALALH